MADLLTDLRESQESIFEIPNKTGAETSAPVPEGKKVIPEGQTSENLQIGIEKNAKSCSDVDSKIESLLKQMLFGSVSMADIFRLVDLEIEWRILNNIEPQFKKELKAWRRLQDKVNLLK